MNTNKIHSIIHKNSHMVEFRFYDMQTKNTIKKVSHACHSSNRASIRSSEDPELMRALYHRRVYSASWYDMNRRILYNRSEMYLRLATFQYIKQNYPNTVPYSDCFWGRATGGSHTGCRTSWRTRTGKWPFSRNARHRSGSPYWTWISLPACTQNDKWPWFSPVNSMPPRVL